MSYKDLKQFIASRLLKELQMSFKGSLRELLRKPDGIPKELRRNLKVTLKKLQNSKKVKSVNY